MKSHHSLCLLGALCAPLFAQEPKFFSRMDAPPGAGGVVRVAGGPISLATAPRGSLLGVSTSPLPAIIREQLDLKQGLVIDYVVEESPAEKAGLKAHDILLQVDDQLLFHPEQLSGLLRYFGAGKDVKLSYLHQGKRTETRCVLQETRGAAAITGDIRIELAQALSQAGFTQSGETTTGNRIDLSQAFTTVMLPDKSVMTIRKKDGVRQAEIKDAKDVVLFDGPVDTEEQRKAVPEAYQRYLNLTEGGLPDFLEKNPSK